MNIFQALTAGARFIERPDARILLGYILHKDRTFLAAHGDTVLTLEEEDSFFELVRKRSAGVPVPYLTGSQAFYGLDFEIGKGALIPRPDTETLVDFALNFIGRRPLYVLDLCTGSAAIAVSIKINAPECVVCASDISDDALYYAGKNIARHAPDIELKKGSFFEPWTGQKFDLIVANPPYVEEGDPHLQNLSYEPKTALCSGADGLDAIRAIIRAAPSYLKTNGVLCLEHGYNQGEKVRGLFQETGFSGIRTQRDLGQNERITLGALRLSSDGLRNPEF